MNTYYIKQGISLDDKYYVYTDNNELYLEIKSSNKLLTAIDRILGSILTLGNKIEVRKIDGKKIITIKKKVGFFREEYDLYNEENTKIASLKRKMLSLKPQISISTKKDSFLINGDLMARNFTIYKNKRIVAQIKKTLLDIKDSYKITISEEADELIYISFLIVIDNSLHN